MASYDSNLRLKFLQDSAKLLNSQSNSTSAHLMVQHNHLLHEESKSIKSRQHESWCGACGSPRRSRHTKVVKVKQRTGRGKNRSVSKNAKIEAIVYKCIRCSQRTVQDQRLHSKPPTRPSVVPAATQNTAVSNCIASASKNSAMSSSDMSSTAEGPIKTTSENASSKKRAKARKQGGLQALLASKQRSQESKQSGSSLDLFDFLQQ